MGKVAAVYNLMPEDPEVSIEGIKEGIPQVIPQGVQVSSLEIRPVAFGLKMIEATFMMEDEEANVDKLEESLQRIDDVQTVENVSVTLV
ncbi:MAG: elongation factor 1-beta [Methanomassiliicoccales archaeon]